MPRDWMARHENRHRESMRRKKPYTPIVHGASMPGKIVPFVNFGAADTPERETAVRAAATEDAERLLKMIDAMLEDERFETKAPFLESVRDWVSERGICTSGQQEAVENVRAFVEDGRGRDRE